MKKLMLIAVLGAALTGGVLAKASTPNIPHVTYEAVEAYVADLFERYDTDGNDQISRAEVLAYYEAELGK